MKSEKPKSETPEQQSEKGILLNVANRVYIRRFPKTEEPRSIRRTYSQALHNLDCLTEEDPNDHRQPA